MNNYTVRVRSGNEEHFVELSFVTLMFYDTIHAEISRLCGDFTAFQYEDEDGDRITVKSDTDLAGFKEGLENRTVDTIILLQPERSNLEIAEILPTDLQHLDVISSGQFGTVFRSLHLPSDQIVAVKCIEVSENSDEKLDVMKEIKFLKECDSSDFIVLLKGASFDVNIFLICLEYMDGGSVSNFAPIPTDVLQHVALSIFEGLKFIWNKKIMHRDLKPENVLINSSGYVKLSDFGVSKMMDHSIARSFVGTSSYMAPERVRGGEYRLESDIWSFGLAVWELFLGKFPVDPNQNLVGNYWQHFITIQRNSLSSGVKPSLVELIQNCVCPDVPNRWNQAQLQQAAFLTIQLDRSFIASFMKNLHIGRVDYQNISAFANSEGFVEDRAENLLWVAGPDRLQAADLTTYEIVRDFNWTEQKIEASIVNLQLFYDSGEICVIFSDGNVLVVNSTDGTMTKNELSPTITAAAWSPDLSVLAASDGGTIVFFDSELNTTERGKDEQVTVGWGAKETQFQGSVGKAAREKQVHIDKKVFEDDTGKDYIRWRNDGLVLISHKVEDTSERHILIFNKDGELMSRLKNERPLEEIFAVRPVGNYIATTTKNEDGTRRLIFFERNGEQRHDYNLTTSAKDKLIDIDWDLSGTALMFHYRCEHHDRVELWTVSNYDWTIKWSHIFKERIVSIKWDAEKALILLLISRRGEFARLSFAQNYCQLGSTVCVASNEGLQITDLSRVLIPPPMYEYLLPYSSQQIFAYDDNRLVVLSVDWNKKENRFTFDNTLQVTPEADWIIISCAQIFQNDLVLVVNGVRIIRICLSTGSWTEISSLPQGPIVAICEHHSDLIALCSEGACFKYSNEGWHKLYAISDANFYDIKCSNGNVVVLTSSNELFLNGRSIVTSVRSFLLANDICIYITLQNQIFFAELGTDFKHLDKVRSVELGSELVACIPQKMSLVMQMPRGNLETIYPRTFVVQVVRNLIKSTKYVEALRVMKKHRINMNILVDDGYDNFVNNCGRLFDDDSSADLLDLFVASVSNDLSEFCTGTVVENKVEKVADLMEASIFNLEKTKRLAFFTVLLSALLKHSRPKIEEALQHIKQQTDEMETQEKDHYSRHWLHHVGFFVGEKEIFNAALATYDLHLTVQVAEASNRDPKEYLPLLNELRKVEPEQYRKYKIQVVREDWVAALRELAELPDKIDEAISLINSRHLYSQALRFFNGKEHFNKIAEVVAIHLENKGQWNEARLLYEKTGKHEKVLECLELSRNVSAFKEAGDRFKIQEDVLLQKLRKMAIHLESEGNFEEAYKALKLCKATSSQIVQVLVKACQWLEAAEYLKSEPNVRSALENAAKSRVDLLHTEITNRSINITKYYNRLEVVRNIKEQRIQNLKEGLESGRDLEDIDAFSEAGSTISMLSKRTGRTGSSRASTTATVRKRKQIEKKKQSLKEGGEYEDSALLLALHEQYKWIEATCREALKLLLCLTELNLYDEAYRLQSALEELCQLSKSKHPHIWPSKLYPKHLCGPLQLIYSVDDTFLFPEEGGMPRMITIEPEMVPPSIVDSTSWRLLCFQ